MAHEETEWTAEEREALDRLPMEAAPGRLLEEKTVAALKERGLLRDGGRRAGSSGDERRAGTGHRSGTGRGRPRFTGPLHPAWLAAGIAAALALFFAGLALGQSRAGIDAEDLVTALHSAEATERPSLVQRTGSLYVDAVASLAAVRQDPETLGTGVEVGLAALYAAAYELARLHPDDPRLRQVIEVLGSQEANGDPETDVHWF